MALAPRDDRPTGIAAALSVLGITAEPGTFVPLDGIRVNYPQYGEITATVTLHRRLTLDEANALNDAMNPTQGTFWAGGLLEPGDIDRAFGDAGGHHPPPR